LEYLNYKIDLFYISLYDIKQIMDNFDEISINEHELYAKIEYYLPQDIKTKIYNDHFHIKHKCDELLKWWNDNYELSCTACDVENLTNEILSNKEGVEYIKKHNPHFEHVYKEHFIDNLHPQKGFSLMNKTQSLITSVLFYMWH